MHVKKIALFATSVALVLPASAAADYAHVVTHGETLTSIAATDGLSLNALAAANGVSSAANVWVGEVVQIPPLSRATRAGGSSGSHAAVSDASDASSGAKPAGSYVVQAGDTLSAIAAHAGTTVAALAALNGIAPNGLILAGTTLSLPSASSPAPSTGASSSVGSATEPGTSYIVQPGDTLSALALRTGTTVAALAALNGLRSDGLLLIGSTLSLPTGGAVSTVGPATGAGNQQVAGDTSQGPYPTQERVTSSQIGAQASADSVDPSLAEAVGWQESGDNNDVVSPTGAVGVMQIEPATWAWINDVLTPGARLSPNSAYDNVAGGVLLLGDLVAQTGSESLAAAAYYQGLQSLREHGMYLSTQQYVNDVLALQRQFGG